MSRSKQKQEKQENLTARDLTNVAEVAEAAVMANRNRRKRIRKGFFGGAAALVVFITTYMLILPAITMSVAPVCGIEEHTHTDACYETKQVLVCTQTEAAGHTHSDACYTHTSNLTCGQAEAAGHTHGSGCYDEEGNLICTQAESAGHTHSDACYTDEAVLSCGQEEAAGHTHTDACYTEETTLVCTLPEHTHTDDCYPAPEPEPEPEETVEEVEAPEEEVDPNEVAGYGDTGADLESRSDWEATLKDVTLTGNWAQDVLAIADTQLGYHESKKNYVEFADGKRKGYSRFGAWYGSPYGDWCAMFCSFCLYYAEVPTSAIPQHSGCPAWIAKLREWGLYRSASSGYSPKAGDLIFYDWDSDGVCDHVGLVYEPQTQSDGSIFLKTIEGNVSDSVQYSGYKLGDRRILGFGELPENPDYVDPDTLEEEIPEEEIIEDLVDPEEEEEIETYTLTAEGKDYTVTVTYTADANLPEGVALSVRELKGSEYDEKVEEARSAMGVEELTFARFFDISFVLDGEELEPESRVNVQITLPETDALSGGNTGNIVHFGEDGTEVLPMQSVQDEDGTTFVFGQDSFSVSGVALYANSTATENVSLDNAPTAGAVTGTQVSTPVVGDWYILYGYIEGNAKYNVGQAISATNPTEQAPLNQVSADGGTVGYSGNMDIAWQYTGDGFRNRNGEFLTLTYFNGNGVTQVGIDTDTTNANVKYDNDYHILYNTQTVNGTITYNKIYMHDWEGVTEAVNESYQGKVQRDATPIYLARVTYSGYEGESTADGNHPQCAVTGTPSLTNLTLYSMYASDSGLDAVEGVVYTVYDAAGNVVLSKATTDSFGLSLGSLPAGTYTVKQTKVPSGYVLNPEVKTFTVGSDGYAFIGSFFVYKPGENLSAADKTAAVYDYVNRVYQVDLNAASGAYRFDMEAVNYSLVVDQSNSMLFPAELTSTGKTITFETGSTQNNRKNTQKLEALNLDKSKVYYVIADESTTSTVFAIWYNGTGWVYQDAAYYAKAQFAVAGLPNSTEGGGYVVYAQTGAGYSADYSADGKTIKAYGGGDIDIGLGGTFSSDISKGKTFTLYTGSTYNRLHELQQAVAAFATQLASLNQDATLDLVTFDKEVESCYENIQLNPNNVKTVITYVNGITTSGGTRQEKALRHLIGTHGGNGTANHSKSHLNNGTNIVILITDGAPVKSGDDSAIVTNDLINAADEIEAKGVKLVITVGLSMKNVQYGTQQLKGAATSEDWYFPSEQTGQLTDILVKKVLFKLGKKTYLESTGDIKDVISDSFYPVNPANNQPLTNGTKIALDGTVDANGPGTVYYDSEKKEWYVVWNNQTLGTGAAAVEGTPGTAGTTVYTYNSNQNFNGSQTVTLDTSKWYYLTYNSSDNITISNTSGNSGTPGNWISTNNDLLRWDGSEWRIYWKNNNGSTSAVERGNVRVTTTGGTAGTEGTPASPAWHGTVYIKAKEDFIGGNDIDTNKSATVTIKASDGSDTAEIALETPSVNVRLLPMEGFVSEETRFLGDSVENIKTKLSYLLNQTVISKINPYYGTDNVLNYKTVTGDTPGLYENHFTLGYAIRDLTDEEWNKLLAGETVSIDYTYDNDSSHGAVGYFSFSLTKTGEGADYKDHETTKTGEDVETYTLKVTYTAYKIGESDVGGNVRGSNVHNGAAGPGTEVGTGKTIENGLGTESVDEIHHVHVIDGEIFLTKVIDDKLKSDKDQTYTFEIYGTDKNGDVSGTALTTVEVTVPAGQTTATIKIGPLARDTYTVKETASDDYMVSAVEVIAGDTVCDYTSEKPTLVFKIGTNTNSKGENDDVIITNTNAPIYEQSVWVNEERYVYSKPFEKPGEEESGDSSGSGTPVIENVDVTTYDWASGTLISTDTSGDKYVKLNQSAEQLAENHTGYGVLTQDAANKDSWSVVWHTWTSEQVTSGSGTSVSYEPVTLTYYQNRTDDFSAYTNGGYYYLDGAEYKEITAITDNWQLTITAGGITYSNLGPTTNQWSGTLNDNVLTYSYIYKKTTTGGTTTTTVWTEQVSDSTPAVSSKIPTTTTTQQVEIEVPDSGGSDSTEVETVSSVKLSFGHGEITNGEAIYTSEIPVEKRWDDGADHSSDTVYVVLYQNSVPVKDVNENAQMIALTAADNWKGSFTVSAPSKNYNPLEDGYEIREVSVIKEQQDEEQSLIPAVLIIGNTLQTKYVATAVVNDLITIGGSKYSVYYTTDDATLVVVNRTAYSLPKTGGSGTRMFTIAGLALMAAAFVIGLGTRRKRERRTEF